MKTSCERMASRRSPSVARRLPLSGDSHCHLDPDLVKEVAPRHAWKAALGQCDAADGHLRNQGIAKGDVFLFFGTFRHSDGKRLIERALLHVIFGYLQVGEIYRTDDSCCGAPDWSHSHFESGYALRRGKPRTNSVYATSTELTIAERSVGLPGHGMFRYSDALVLTRAGAASHTEWALPLDFKRVAISYHPDGGRYGWRPDGYFQSAHRGQEFVFNATDNAVEWFEKTVLSARHVATQ
jgi:hypothetical protein